MQTFPILPVPSVTMSHPIFIPPTWKMCKLLTCTQFLHVPGNKSNKVHIWDMIMLCKNRKHREIVHPVPAYQYTSRNSSKNLLSLFVFVNTWKTGQLFSFIGDLTGCKFEIWTKEGTFLKQMLWWPSDSYITFRHYKLLDLKAPDIYVLSSH